MQIAIEVPMTDEEIKKEIEETTEEFRRRGLLPIESEETDAANN